MSYLRKDDLGEGFPRIHDHRNSRDNIRRSLTRLDDLDGDRRVTFQSPTTSEPQRRRSRSPSPFRRSSSPHAGSRSSSPFRRPPSPARSLDAPIDVHKSWSISQRDEVERARGDMAALQVKVDTITRQLGEAELSNESNHAKVRELKTQLETSRENEARQVSLADSLRLRQRDSETRMATLQSKASQGDMAVEGLQKEISELQLRLQDSKAQLRDHLSKYDEATSRTSSWEKKYQETLIMFRSALGVDYNEPVDMMKSKIQEMSNENKLFKGKCLTLEESLHSYEVEAKASRETITRLVTEVNREQGSASRHNAELENTRMERDAELNAHRDLEQQVRILQERLDSNQRAWSATKRELEEKDRVYDSVDREVRENSAAARLAQTQLIKFRDELASVLTTRLHMCSPSEEVILDRIRQIQLVEKDRQSTIDVLEHKIQDLEMQAKRNYELYQDSEKQHRRSDVDARDLSDRLKRYEHDMATGESFRDGLRRDKEKYLGFLEKIASIMKLDRISADVGFDMSGDAILARAQQLVKLEADALADRSTHIYNLQRKIRTMREQLDSKDLHLDLLRKKVTQTEERLVGRSELEREREGEVARRSKTERLADKYRRELEETRVLVVELKAQLLESTKVEVVNRDVVARCEELEARLSQIDRIRQKQAKKITTLKDEVCTTEHDTEAKRTQAGNAIQALSSELKTTKDLLTDVAKREKQLVDLRTVVARMLGLDISTLAVPDYEIISRLEKLVQSHHAHTLTGWTVDQALEDMEDGFRAGHDDSRIYLGEPMRTSSTKALRSRPTSAERERRTRSPRRRSPSKRRERSVSPSKIDSRKY